MADYGHQLTEKELRKLEKKIAAEYRRANRDAEQKLQEYLQKTENQRKAEAAKLEAGKISKTDYDNWVFRHTMMGKRWEDMKNVLAADYHNANIIARQMAEKKMPDIYALNANYAMYHIENQARIDLSFTLYNHDTAEYLLKQQRQMMPPPSPSLAKKIAANKDMQWNKNKIQSCVLQGILQGESPYDVARRLMTVGQMNFNAAVRYARTMTTNVQNAGRYEAFHRAEELGVDLTIEWQATLDHATRDTHRDLHGQRRDVDEPFIVDGIEILWPAQTRYNSSDIPQQMIWNCRCTLLSWVKGYEGNTVKSSPKMGDMTYEEWKEGKKK